MVIPRMRSVILKIMLTGFRVAVVMQGLSRVCLPDLLCIKTREFVVCNVEVVVAVQLILISTTTLVGAVVSRFNALLLHWLAPHSVEVVQNLRQAKEFYFL